MKIAGIYSFNNGRNIIEKKYPQLLKEITQVIGSINEEEHKTKKSKEVTMPGEIAVLIGLRCAWLWQPERQVRLHQEHLLQAVQDRDWWKFDGFFDDGFRTPTGRDKAWALQQSREVLGQFNTLEIRASDTTITMEGGTARVRALIRIEGTGSELAETAKSEVNGSDEPFEFVWKRISWLPWEWRLTGVEHPLLHLDAGME